MPRLIMPRLLLCALAFSGGCFFEADYRGGTLQCSDGRCPSGLTCVAGTCRADVPDDAGVDAAVDAPEAALTCADPGVIAGSGTVAGTTVGRPSNLAAMCGGFVMNGREAVYRIDLVAGDQLLVAITGARKAYVIAACVTPPPACLGNLRAVDGNPISVMPAAGPSFVVVDDENPAAEGTYSLTLTVF
jgi:hypothetical protein